MRQKVFWYSIGITALIGLFPLVAWSQTLPLVTAKAGGGGTIYAVPVETILALVEVAKSIKCVVVNNGVIQK